MKLLSAIKNTALYCWAALCLLYTSFQK